VALDDGSDVIIGNYRYKLDRSRVQIGIMPFRRTSRSIFPEEQLVFGKAGDRNIRLEQLLWNITDFAGGEGQKVLAADDDSFTRFYRSEGLDFRTAGEFKLNPPTLLQRPTVTGEQSITTFTNTDFSDVTGTSTTVDGDRRLNLIGDTIKTSNTSPGDSTHEVRFWAYTEGPSSTTIQGDSFIREAGDVNFNGDDAVLKNPGARVKSPSQASLDTDIPQQCDFYLFSPGLDPFNEPRATVKILDTTGNDDSVVAQTTSIAIANTSTPATPTASLTWQPKQGHTYRAVVNFNSRPPLSDAAIHLDRVTLAELKDPTNSITVSVYNQTDSVVTKSKRIFLSNTTAKELVALEYLGVSGKTYSYRVEYESGEQRPIVNKVRDIRQSTGTKNYQPECIDLGQGGNIWLACSATGQPPSVFQYNFSTEEWDQKFSITAAASGATIVSMAHTDKYEYLATSDDIIWRCTASGATQYTTAAAIESSNIRGICITQNRIIALAEKSATGVDVYTLPVDSESGLPITTYTKKVGITSAKNSPTARLRQRIVGTPTGARFYVNYSDIWTEIWEVDASGAELVRRKIADFEPGVKITAITHTAGLTFLGGQFKAETGETPRSALWVIDANGVPQRIGYFRRDDPDANEPIGMQAYENDLWIAQGQYVWRYSLISGGLFLEAKLNSEDAASQRGIAVLRGHQFMPHQNDGVWSIGSLTGYRQAGVDQGGGRLETSVNDFSLSGRTKILHDIRLLTYDMPTDTRVIVEYQKDQDATWVLAGVASTGARHTFPISTEQETVHFGSLQARITPESLEGTNTPTVLAAVVASSLVEEEEFFEVRLLINDEDAGFHIAGQQATGGELASNIFDLKNAGKLVTFVDGYTDSSEYAPNREYLVKIERVEQENIAVGEGNMLVRLRVLDVPV